MAVKVGILGMGMIGKIHLDSYAAVREAKVAAVCDADKAKHTGRWPKAIGEGMEEVDFSKQRLYAKAADLFADPDVDVVDVCLPTYMHATYSIAALEAGKHVICEKPMARTAVEAKKMVAAAGKAKRKLFIAHCIRFWPAYAKAREIVLGGRWGAVRTARFCRIGSLPMWGWRNWLQNPAQSGLCALDLHIHDADFVQYLFGKPKAVTSRAGGLKRNRLDHIVTAYQYEPGQLITAEGAWEYAPGYPFSMTFSIAMEKATLALGGHGQLMLYPAKGGAKPVKTAAGDGYVHELRHFVRCIRTGAASDVAPAESALATMKLVEAEIESARLNLRVPVRF